MQPEGSPEVDVEIVAAAYVARKYESWRKEMKNISAQIKQLILRVG